MLSFLGFKSRGLKRGSRLLRKVGADMELGASTDGSGLFSARIRGPHHCGVWLYGQSDAKNVVIWTVLEINVRPDRCSREMLTLLLKRNVEQCFGRIGLHDGPMGIRIVMTESIPHGKLRASVLYIVVDALINQSRDLAYQLYAEGFVKRVNDWEDDPYAWG